MGDIGPADMGDIGPRDMGGPEGHLTRAQLVTGGRIKPSSGRESS
jgi:hypothetical protein